MIFVQHTIKGNQPLSECQYPELLVLLWPQFVSLLYLSTTWLITKQLNSKTKRVLDLILMDQQMKVTGILLSGQQVND